MHLLPRVRSIIKKNNCHDCSFTVPSEYKSIYQFFSDNKDLQNEKRYNPDKNDDYFINKFIKHIPQGWYGFSLGEPIHPEWVESLDQILDLMVSVDPDFAIQQIKIKFGGVRFYVSSNVIEDIGEIESYIENVMFDEMLIY